MSQAFAPVLAANGGGALLNVLSIVSWINGGAARGVRGQQVGGLVADQRAAPRAGGAADAGAGAAHGLRRHRPRARASTARRPAPTTSSRARSTGSRPGSTKCWPTSARSSSSRACRRRGRATCRSSPDPRRPHTPEPPMTLPPLPAAAAEPPPARSIALARVLGRERRGLPGLARHHDAVRGLRRAARRLSRRQRGRHVVGAQRLHGGLCGDADPRRRPGRHARPQARVPARRDAVHRRVGGCAAWPAASAG